MAVVVAVLVIQTQTAQAAQVAVEMERPAVLVELVLRIEAAVVAA
jgi:hypothetical protein